VGLGTNGWALVASPSLGAEIALQAEGPEQAVEEALKAIELAQQGRRLKYETLARTILGTALVALGRWEEGLGELRTAVEGANRLGTPSGRWDAMGALGKALYARGDDDGAATAYHRAAEAIRAFSATLTAEHANSLLAASPISELLSASA